MTKSKTLMFDDKCIEHELFRSCMQLVVGIEQGHEHEALLRYAATLRELANKHIHWSEYV